MRLIPVLDIKSGSAVHAVAGKRDLYQPVQSCLAPSCDPLALASAFRNELGLDQLYLADLDAIGGQPAAVQLYADLADLGLDLVVDAGVTGREALAWTSQAPVSSVVIGLETIESPEALDAVVAQLGTDRTVFSLDLCEGHPLGNLAAWHNATAAGVAAQAIDIGIRRLIILDLARVGMEEGMGTESLCRSITSTRPDLELIVGGGVRGLRDLERIRQFGVSAVLVATALHKGQIDRADLEIFNGSDTS